MSDSAIHGARVHLVAIVMDRLVPDANGKVYETVLNVYKSGFEDGGMTIVDALIEAGVCTEDQAHDALESANAKREAQKGNPLGNLFGAAAPNDLSGLG